MPFERRKYECPRCHRDGKIYIKRKSYVVFVCFCGVLITDSDIDGLKNKLRELNRGRRLNV